MSSSSLSKWLLNLNPEQAEAVIHNFGPLLILAGAGSGKTTVLVSRTGRLIEEQIAKANEICVLTFTNKAARELQHRVSAKLGGLSKGLWAGTFHSFGLQILRRFHKHAELPKSFGLLDQGDASALVKELLRGLNNSGKTSYDAEKLLSIIGAWRERGQTHATSDNDYDVAVEWLLPRYLRKMKSLGVVDFESLILKPVELFEKNPDVLHKVQSQFRQVMVDEFQDTNAAQMRLVRALVNSHQNVTVVGDDDQSIYGWRGACVSNILDFPQTFKGCKVVRLERNYRSTPAILDLANAVIAKNEKRHGKVLRADPNISSGFKPEVFAFENEDRESEFIAREIHEFHKKGHHFKDIAVLYRSNGQGALLESELRQAMIPYALTGGTAFFDRKETKDILAFLRTAIAPNEVGLRRVINVPARGVGETSIDRISEFADAKGISFVSSAKRWKEAGLTDSAGASLDLFFQHLDALKTNVLTGPAEQADQRLLSELIALGYKDYIQHQYPHPMMAAQRWRLVEIFCGVLVKFLVKGGVKESTIKDFIDAMSLKDYGVADEEQDTSQVQLLTLHACKGLEFPIVFLIGLEEDIIPHKTLGGDISEERRLFYVGVTRARERLILTRAKERKRYGKMMKATPSRYLVEIPEHLLTIHEFEGRPVSEDQRKSLMADLFKRIESNKKTIT